MKTAHILQAAVGSTLEREDHADADGPESKQQKKKCCEVWLLSVFSHKGLREEEMSTFCAPKSTDEAS